MHPTICRVTSSPDRPSPRDTHRTRRPRSYLTDADAPSIFGSAQKRIGASRAPAVPGPSPPPSQNSPPSARRARCTKAAASSASKAFCSDCIGVAWRTCGSASHSSSSASSASFASCASGIGAPTRRVGLSSLASAGNAASRASSRSRSRSYSASVTSGAASR